MDRGRAAADRTLPLREMADFHGGESFLEQTAFYGSGDDSVLVGSTGNSTLLRRRAVTVASPVETGNLEAPRTQGPQSSSPSGQEDNTTIPSVGEINLSKSIPDGDPEGNRKIVDPMRICYPPDFELPIELLDEAAVSKGPGQTGIDAHALVLANRKQARDYIKYAREEKQSQEVIQEAIWNTTQKLMDVKRRIAGLHAALGTTKDIPGGFIDLERTLRLEEQQLRLRIRELENHVLLKRVENEGLVAGMLDGKPLASADIHGVGMPQPHCPPNIPDLDGTIQRGFSSSGRQNSPMKPLSVPEVTLENPFGLTVEGPDPDLRARYKQTYRQGLAAVTPSHEPLKTENRRDTRVPDWFPILDEMGAISLGSKGQSNRYVELLNKIYRLEDEVRRGDGGPLCDKKKAWNKFFHEPNPGWPTAHRQARGGWWRCRTGPEAVPAERACERCHSPPNSINSSQDSNQSSNVPLTPRKQDVIPPSPNFTRQQQQLPPPDQTSQDVLDTIMDLIDKASKVVMERDKKIVAAELELELEH